MDPICVWYAIVRCNSDTVVLRFGNVVPPAVFHRRVHPISLNSGKQLIYNVFSIIAARRRGTMTKPCNKAVDMLKECHV